MADLSAYYPAVRSVALVPVGLTDHRHKLVQLDPVTPVKAAEYADAAKAWGLQFKARFGERFVYAADEIFLLTDQPLPEQRRIMMRFPN